MSQTAIEIKPLPMEVKTLTIDGKKLTKALYQQIEEEFPFDEDVEFNEDTLKLRGTLLGRVSCVVENCGYSDEHLHILWQKGCELRRTVISCNGFDVLNWYDCITNKMIILGSYCAVELSRRTEIVPTDGWGFQAITAFNPGCPEKPVNVYFKDFGARYEVGPFEDLQRAWSHPQKVVREKYLAQLAQETYELVESHFDRPMPLEKARSYYRKLKQERSELVATWFRSYKELKALDQLFIGV